jgi:acyl carrier protein
VTPATDESVTALLAGFFNVPPERLLPETSLDELGIDSLAAVELVFELEERFGVSIPNERAAELHTVRAIAEGVRALQEAGS